MNNSVEWWLIDSDEIRPGKTAVLGGNFVAFYLINIAGIVVIIISICTSLLVVLHILLGWKRSQLKLDMPVRFPLVLAIIDLFWGMTTMTIILYIVEVQTFRKSQFAVDFISGLTCTIYGWLQILNAVISLYTYLRVVHGRKVNLGVWEWKLHLSGIICTAILLPTFYYLDTFGYSGYWIFYNAATKRGMILSAFATIVSTFNAGCSLFCYLGIKRTVIRLKYRLTQHQKGNVKSAASQMADAKGKPKNRHSTAMQCLTTYIWIASCIYFPLAILCWMMLFIHFYWNAVNPIVAGLIVVVANSNGWSNACGYFYNDKIKRDRKTAKCSEISTEGSKI